MGNGNKAPATSVVTLQGNFGESFMKHRLVAAAAVAVLAALPGAGTIAREAGEAPRQEDHREDRQKESATDTVDDHGRHRGGRDEAGSGRSGRSGGEDHSGRRGGEDHSGRGRG
jgi:hypothetical protein